MMLDILLTNMHFQDVNPILVGREVCAAGKSFGPTIRKYTLLHYVESGCGVFYKKGVAYPVHEGEAFIILPDEVTVYTADSITPWTYRWIAFDGKQSERFRQLPPVVRLSDELFPRLPDESDGHGVLEYVLAGQIWGMMSELFAGEKKQSNHYVRQVKDYIKSSYMNELQVEQIADSLNLDRRYLSRLFKSKTGKTIQEYLISVRMEEAKKLLGDGHGVAETANLCGYSDYCNFSKMFKRIYGVSPAKWKKDEGDVGDDDKSKIKIEDSVWSECSVCCD